MGQIVDVTEDKSACVDGDGDDEGRACKENWRGWLQKSRNLGGQSDCWRWCLRGGKRSDKRVWRTRMVINLLLPSHVWKYCLRCAASTLRTTHQGSPHKTVCTSPSAQSSIKECDVIAPRYWSKKNRGKHSVHVQDLNAGPKQKGGGRTSGLLRSNRSWSCTTRTQTTRLLRHMACWKNVHFAHNIYLAIRSVHLQRIKERYDMFAFAMRLVAATLHESDIFPDDVAKGGWHESLPAPSAFYSMMGGV